MHAMTADDWSFLLVIGIGAVCLVFWLFFIRKRGS